MIDFELISMIVEYFNLRCWMSSFNQANLFNQQMQVTKEVNQAGYCQYLHNSVVTLAFCCSNGILSFQKYKFTSSLVGVSSQSACSLNFRSSVYLYDPFLYGELRRWNMEVKRLLFTVASFALIDYVACEILCQFCKCEVNLVVCRNPNTISNISAPNRLNFSKINLM